MWLEPQIYPVYVQKKLECLVSCAALITRQPDTLVHLRRGGIEYYKVNFPDIIQFVPYGSP